MIEIKIQKKKKPVWPWLFALLLTLALVWYLGKNSSRKSTTSKIVIPIGTVDGLSPQISTIVSPVEINELTEIELYSSFIRKNEETFNSKLVITKGMKHLEAVINSFLETEDSISSDIKNKHLLFKKKSKQLQHSESAPEVAAIVREGFISTSELLNNLQSEHYPALKKEAAQVQKAAVSIAANKPVSSQQETILNFYKNSETLFYKMARQQKSLKK